MYYGILNFIIYILVLLMILPLIRQHDECQSLMRISKAHMLGQLFIGFCLALILILVLAIINIVFFQSFSFFQFVHLRMRAQVNFVAFQLLVAVTEELLFRGYLLFFFAKICKSNLLSAFLSSVLFAFFHYVFNHNMIQLITAFVIGLLFSIVLIKNKKCSIYSLILAHLLYDLAIVNV